MKHHLRLNFPLLRYDPVRVRLRLVLQQQQQDEQVEERRGPLLLFLVPPPGPAATLPCKISHRLACSVSRLLPHHVHNSAVAAHDSAWCAVAVAVVVEAAVAGCSWESSGCCYPRPHPAVLVFSSSSHVHVSPACVCCTSPGERVFHTLSFSRRPPPADRHSLSLL